MRLKPRLASMKNCGAIIHHFILDATLVALFWGSKIEYLNICSYINQGRIGCQIIHAKCGGGRNGPESRKDEIAFLLPDYWRILSAGREYSPIIVEAKAAGCRLAAIKGRPAGKSACPDKRVHETSRIITW
jgi:hypothetical protein